MTDQNKNVGPDSPEFTARITKIQTSIDKINKLMSDLEIMNTDAAPELPPPPPPPGQVLLDKIGTVVAWLFAAIIMVPILVMAAMGFGQMAVASPVLLMLFVIFSWPAIEKHFR